MTFRGDITILISRQKNSLLIRLMMLYQDNYTQDNTNLHGSSNLGVTEETHQVFEVKLHVGVPRSPATSCRGLGLLFSGLSACFLRLTSCTYSCPMLRLRSTMYRFLEIYVAIWSTKFYIGDTGVSFNRNT